MHRMQRADSGTTRPVDRIAQTAAVASVPAFARHHCDFFSDACCVRSLIFARCFVLYVCFARALCVCVVCQFFVLSSWPRWPWPPVAVWSRKARLEARPWACPVVRQWA